MWTGAQGRPIIFCRAASRFRKRGELVYIEDVGRSNISMRIMRFDLFLDSLSAASEIAAKWRIEQLDDLIPEARRHWPE